MKNILNFIRIVIIIYLICITIIFVSMFTQKKINKNEFPTLMGYSYMKIDSDIYSDIKKDNIIILKKSKNVSENDYVAYKYNDVVKLGKIVKTDKYKVYINDDNGVLKEYDLENIYGKMIYNNDTFSKVMNILTNWIVLVILLFIGTILPELIFNN